ncbi:Hypothetical protein FKW44_006684 [Caligus rogercresseyi]|uniref:Uncharacterized protein n=1 Tax=Caligus rogercresseyi TaxID=217165 RepID=A0A7T8KDY4_CALRO|nr:Hypothetical protein FKW44_006684 [Caligus rogercresseyi]
MVGKEMWPPSSPDLIRSTILSGDIVKGGVHGQGYVGESLHRFQGLQTDAEGYYLNNSL